MSKPSYYLPEPSHWPIVGSVSIFLMLSGAAHWLHSQAYGPYLCLIGFMGLLVMFFGWFGTVIKENQAGAFLHPQVDRSFRWGMFAFIFSEAMFFFAFFGSLFYIRLFAVPWLGGSGEHGIITHFLLWPSFHIEWPLLKNPNNGFFIGPKSVMETWQIPAINTLLLLSSAVTVTIAHFALIKDKRNRMLIFQGLTVLLGITFLFMQAHEYGIAYTEKGLTLASGIFGSTFFILTGFHCAHVTVGLIMLIVIWIRMMFRHFTPDQHFAFEAVAWYWHFVDVVWLFLFIFVYWI